MNLRKLSLRQLDALGAKIERRRQQLRRAQAADVRRRVLQEIRSAGLSLAEVLSGAVGAKRPAAAGKVAAGRRRRRKAGAGRSRKSSAAAVRGVTYANPANPAMTWSGYGRRPQWYLDALAAGKDESQLRAGGGATGKRGKAQPAKARRKSGKGRKRKSARAARKAA